MGPFFSTGPSSEVAVIVSYCITVCTSCKEIIDPLEVKPIFRAVPECGCLQENECHEIILNLPWDPVEVPSLVLRR